MRSPGESNARFLKTTGRNSSFTNLSFFLDNILNIQGGGHYSSLYNPDNLSVNLKINDLEFNLIPFVPHGWFFSEDNLRNSAIWGAKVETCVMDFTWYFKEGALFQDHGTKKCYKVRFNVDCSQFLLCYKRDLVQV